MISIQSKAGSAMITSVVASGVFFFTPTIADASFGNKLLSIGSNHEDVSQLQKVLKTKGFFKYQTTTGYFGEVTKQAVKDFQKANQLEVDGIAGPQTFAALKTGTVEQAKPDKKSSKENTTTAKKTYIAEQTATTLNEQQILRQLAKGIEVDKLQIALGKMGFFNNDVVTGSYGDMTKKAVINFQKARGLTVDGIAGPQTLAQLNKEIRVGETAKHTSSNNSSASVKTNSSDQKNTFLREGTQGNDVRELQEQLKSLNYYGGTVTGTFDSRTTESVKEFQRVAGITVDGIAGSQTFQSLKTAKPKSVSQEGESTSGNTTSPSQNLGLKEGVTSSKVTELQNMLKAIGIFNTDISGHFGAVTKESVQKFQRNWDLIADGIVTQSTWSKLEEISSIHLNNAKNVSSTTSFNMMNVVADASTVIGVPYLWGGVTTAGFDCSGFIQYVFKKNSVNLPRTVAEQWDSMKTVSSLKVGDLVFFETYKKGPSHNGIYIGNNQFVHSGSSTGVTIANLNSNYWSKRYLGAKRIN